MIDQDEKVIREVVKYYFIGTYNGDAKQVQQAFHPQARIVGNINGETFDLSLSDFIARVTATPTAAAKGEKYDKEILLVDKTGDVAIVKARVVIGPYVFTDYITLLKIAGKWVIRHKSFST